MKKENNIPQEMIDLESQFKQALQDSKKEFDDQYKKIEDEIEKLTLIAEKYKVPFRLKISHFENDYDGITAIYTPKTFEKWGKLFDCEYWEEELNNFEKCDEFHDLLPQNMGESGWNYSRIC